jgi:hypothetical protein
MSLVKRFWWRWTWPTILVAALAVAAFVSQQGPERASGGATTIGRSRVAVPAASATSTPSPTPARPSAKAIYKGHTLEEILADPALLEAIQAEADYSRPIHGEPDRPISNGDSDTICPNHVECP